MAKTIRSHPTCPFIPPEPILWTTLLFSKSGPKMHLRVLHFPTPHTGKKTAPQRKKNAHGPSLHIRLLSKRHFLYCMYNHISTVWSKPTLVIYCHMLIVLCISDSNMGDPRLWLFQNRTFISKWEPYPKGNIGKYTIYCMEYWIRYWIGYRIGYWRGYWKGYWIT